MLIAGPYLQGEVFGLVGPDGRNAQDEFLLTHVEVLSNTGGLNDGKSVLVDSTDEIGSHVDRILGKGIAAILEGARGQILGSGLVRVKEKLDSMYSRVTPVDLTTPFELGRVVVIVQDQSGNLGLAVAFETWGESVSDLDVRVSGTIAFTRSCLWNNLQWIQFSLDNHQWDSLQWDAFQ